MSLHITEAARKIVVPPVASQDIALGRTVTATEAVQPSGLRESAHDTLGPP